MRLLPERAIINRGLARVKRMFLPNKNGDKIVYIYQLCGGKMVKMIDYIVICRVSLKG